ncbi:phosphatase 2A-associated protein [Neohortaea acidophila]|uniref:Phosphatase 2A-associated protein n=1 Tax=Neohortaea acidophila TaxID=245834 RepID=A0A6A6PT06_9PEZI|nr:phosphatase 2A-associated protein [Neohortaea acidophila]KAF2483015.1 phosphatase 2A-associated protein [Neohortaea acidophila]
MMAHEGRTLREIYDEAGAKRDLVNHSFDSNSPAFQQNVLSAVELYERCLDLANRLSLFSPNESLDDISSADLQYLLLDYWLAEVVLRINDRNRRVNLLRAQSSHESYLKQLDNYDMLSKGDASLLQQYYDAPTTFSTASTADAAARRDTKIRRFKEEKALKQRLDYLESNKRTLSTDDGAYRELQLANIAYCTHQAFQSLESIAQELQILALAPSSPPAPPSSEDARERNGRGADGYSERLDSSIPQLSAGLRGPLLDNKGKPLRPFTLTSKRQEFRNGVFRPDHSLPTMSIDEYLEEERRRGGMIDGGGPQSQVRPQVDEDDVDAADRETMKAREWDEFVEANPRGSGNTINRG